MFILAGTWDFFFLFLFSNLDILSPHPYPYCKRKSDSIQLVKTFHPIELSSQIERLEDDQDREAKVSKEYYQLDQLFLQRVLNMNIDIIQKK